MPPFKSSYEFDWVTGDGRYKEPRGKAAGSAQDPSPLKSFLQEEPGPLPQDAEDLENKIDDKLPDDLAAVGFSEDDLDADARALAQQLIGRGNTLGIARFIENSEGIIWGPNLRPLNLMPWNPYLVPLNGTVTCLARRGLGKTTALKHHLSKLGPFYPKGLVFSMSERFNHTFQKFIPKSCIYSKGFSRELAGSLWNIQEQILDDPQHDKKRQKHPHYHRALFVADDIIQDYRHYARVKEFEQVWTTGRHAHTLVWWNSQYLYSVPPVAHENTDAAIMFTQDTDRSREYLYDLFGGPWMYRTMFERVMSTVCEDHPRHALVFFNAHGTERKLINRYFTYMAPYWETLSMPKLFLKEYWEASEKKPQGHDPASLMQQAIRDAGISVF